MAFARKSIFIAMWVSAVLTYGQENALVLQADALPFDTQPTVTRPALISLTKPLDSHSVTGAQGILYLGGGPGSPWSHIGTLEAIERFKVPVHRIISSGWGSWVAALWAEGYSAEQIQSILDHAKLMQVEDLQSIESSDPKPLDDKAEPTWSELISAKSYPSFRVEFSFIKSDSSTQLRPLIQSRQPINHAMRLKLEEPLLNIHASKRQARLPWQVVLCDTESASLVLSQDRPALSWILTSMDLRSQVIGNRRVQRSETCTSSPDEWIQSWLDSGYVLYASGWPKRLESLPISAKDRYRLEQFRNSKTSSNLIPVDAHRIHSDSAKYGSHWKRLGFEAMRSRLGDLVRFTATPKDWTVQERPLITKDVTPVMDGIAAEYQNHLQSYWNPESPTWDLRTEQFAKEIESSRLYDSLRMQLALQAVNEFGDASPDSSIPVLNVRANPRTLLITHSGVLGVSYLGPVAFGALEFKTVNQFEYRLGVQGFYGNQLQGIVPFITVSRIHGGALAFSGLGRFMNWDLLPAWSRLSLSDSTSTLSEYSYSNQIRLNEVLVRVHWKQDALTEWSPYIMLSQNQFKTKQIYFLNQTLYEENPRGPLEVNAVVAGVDVRYENHDQALQWYAPASYGAHGGFAIKSEAPKIIGGAPTHLNFALTGSGAATMDAKSWLRIGVRGSLGVQGRVLEGMIWEYPDSIDIIPESVSDDAISNYYRLPISATPFTEGMPLAQFQSHQFVVATAHAAIHNQEKGLWLHASWLNDFEGADDRNQLSAQRVSLESSLRYQWKSIDMRLGMHLTANSNAIQEQIQDRDRWTLFFQVGNIPFSVYSANPYER